MVRQTTRHDAILQRVVLTGWRGVYRVEFVPMFSQVFERVGLVKLERVVRLWVDIDTNNVETGSVVTHSGATGTTEQIE